MEIIIIIGILIALAFFVSAAQVGLSAKTASTGGDAFSTIYRSEYGVEPPTAARSAISSGMGVISAFSGSGKEALGRERLNNAIREYGNAVNWDESKMELGLGCLLALCVNQKGEPKRGFQWATDLITNSMSLYCPALMNRVYGGMRGF